MTIEDKCNSILKIKNFGFTARTMSIWEWQGRPKSHIIIEKMVKAHPGAKEMAEHLAKPFVKVDDLIRTADTAECLLSNCLYIRECKKWFLGDLKKK